MNEHFFTRPSRSYPGYYYRRSDYEPRVVSVFDSNDHSALSPRSEYETPAHSSNCDNFQQRKASSNNIHDDDIGYEKANVKCNIYSDNLKPALTIKENKRFYRDSDYRVDDDDVKTDTNVYDGWPYLYRTRFEYGVNYDPENEKAKDKRYVNDIVERVIPVHEDHEDNVHEIERKREDINPMYGNQAFFSHVLEDYFDRTSEEDPLIFKGLSYNKDFDTVPFNNDGSNKRFRRLNSYDTHTTPYDYNNKFKYDFKTKLGETGEEYNKIGNEYNKSTEDTFKESDKLEHVNDRHKYRGFKDFFDAFVNKFGKEDHNRKVDLTTNKTLEKGEKKKGFRRVYHKDEYQEDNEFFDNTNNKAVLTEIGASQFNNGGSEAILASRASALSENKIDNIHKIENKDSGKSKDSQSTSSGDNRQNLGLQKFQQIAKSTAQQHNADYYDHL